jgi:hypothetical protein
MFLTAIAKDPFYGLRESTAIMTGMEPSRWPKLMVAGGQGRFALADKLFPSNAIREGLASRRNFRGARDCARLGSLCNEFG